MGVDPAFQTANICLQLHPTMSGRIDGPVLNNLVLDSVSFSTVVIWVLSVAQMCVLKARFPMTVQQWSAGPSSMAMRPSFLTARESFGDRT